MQRVITSSLSRTSSGPDSTAIAEMFSSSFQNKCLAGGKSEHIRDKTCHARFLLTGVYNLWGGLGEPYGMKTHDNFSFAEHRFNAKKEVIVSPPRMAV